MSRAKMEIIERTSVRFMFGESVSVVLLPGQFLTQRTQRFAQRDAEKGSPLRTSANASASSVFEKLIRQVNVEAFTALQIYLSPRAASTWLSSSTPSLFMLGSLADSIQRRASSRTLR